MFIYNDNRKVDIVSGSQVPCARYIGVSCYKGILYDIFEDLDNNLYGVLIRF